MFVVGSVLRRTIAIAAAVVSTFAVPAPTLGAPHTVRATDTNTWSPSFLVIARRDKVVWTNPTDVDHTLKSYGGRWTKRGRLRPGEQTSARFRRPGTYKFRCSIHSKLKRGGRCRGMCGKIEVARG